MEPFPWASLAVASRHDRRAGWIDAIFGGGDWVDGVVWRGDGATVQVQQPVVVTARAAAGEAVVSVPAALAIALADDALDRVREAPAPRPASEVEAALLVLAIAVALERAGVAAEVALGGEPVAPVAALLVARPVAAIVGLAARGAAPPRRSRPARATLPEVRAAVALASTTIAWRRLHGLRVRDVVVIGVASPRVEIAGGWFAAALDRGAARLTVSGPYVRAAMSDLDDSGGALADDLRVRLSIVIGEVELSARALLALGPGQVLTTGAPVGTTVELRAGGRAVARGELVSVDGEVGVRITDVLSAAPAA